MPWSGARQYGGFSLRLADVDGDGRLVFAFASWESVESAPAVLRGTPAGGLTLAYSGPWTYTSIAVEDLDGNGWPDLALTRWQHPYGLDVAARQG
jgi:hypothetical protein